MVKKLYTQTKDTGKEKLNVSTAPAQPMFQSRPFVVQPQTAQKPQQPDLKTALMQAERYGHHLDHITSTEPPTPQQAPPVVPAQTIQRKQTTPEVEELQTKPAAETIQRAEEPQEQGEDLETNIRLNNQLLEKLEQEQGQQQPTKPATPASTSAAPAVSNKPLPALPHSAAPAVSNKPALPQPAAPAVSNKPLPALPQKKGRGGHAKINTIKGALATVGLAGAGGAKTVAEHSGILTHGADAIGSTAAAGLASPLAAVGAGRAGRQAVRAKKRANTAANYSEEFNKAVSEKKAAGEDPSQEEKLGKIADYTAKKQKTRAKKQGISAALGTTSAVAGTTSLATGVVTPPGIVAGGVAMGAGVANAALGAHGPVKNLYKRAKGTLGKNREKHATDLYETAKSGHEKAMPFMRDLGILKEGQRPSPEAKGYYAEDLQDEEKREKIIKYTKQKMRS